MSAEQNAGSIVYDISADVAPLLKGEQQANAALGNIGTSAVDTASKFKTLDAQVSKTASGVRSSLKTSMQQAGYQIQDFIVQVQGGQSALVAFSQQGSQLAGAFGPGGAVVGALIALGSVLAGVLITSLNGGKNAMDALKDAAEAMDKVITISSQGVAALSDKYAALARVNAAAATLLRNQAVIEYNQAILKIPKAISDAADSFVTLGDKAMAAFGGASPSIKKFNDELAGLKITTDNWSEAISQAASNGQYASGITNSLAATVNTLASRFGISQQAAFELSKQLSDVSNNPSPEALQALANKIGEMIKSSKDAKPELLELYNKIADLSTAASMAAYNVDKMKSATDNLTSGQKDLIKQSERNLALSKLQGAARAKLQAQYAAEDTGLSKDDPHTVKMMNDAAATYNNIDAQKKLDAQNKKGASQQESIAQKLANLKQQSELAAESTQQLSREQAILTAQQSLGKGATQEQIALAGQYAAQKWDTANALKAQAAAEKLLPETKENASYKQDMLDLKTALDGKKISQEQYNQTSEQLEQQHQANLAKIRAQQTVTPAQSAVAEVDPVQRLANQHAQELALIQQFEQQGVLAHENALALRNAADTQYEQQRISAQWEIYRNQSQANELLASSLEGLQSGASSALTGLINGTQSLQEAFANIGSTILNSVITSLVQMGIEWVKAQLMGQAAAAASLASTVAQATAAASAWAPAAVSASIATYGSAAAVGQAAYAGSLLSAKGMALAGARYNGGPVSANSMYRVGEGGKPEIFKASNGSQYMIPGDNGRVISNKDIGNSGSNGGNTVFNVAFNIQTTNGIDDATMQKMAGMMKQVALYQIKDQSTRPGGMLQPRK
ncbi:tail protein (tape measure) [Phytobacter diazotrophicus]|uniref:tail protein (tape measure) n=1 Tax=Phytobacter diazotrophicus TaxID=395631 RepID=UPI0029365102|nr:tail protein (tape measure) [Phytobacter diazotrophicus]MDV2903069.1 tail protein (tape measure) [Phytobacter diazotrophicus]